MAVLIMNDTAGYQFDIFFLENLEHYKAINFTWVSEPIKEYNMFGYLKILTSSDHI
jgi:hypothetical protein